MKSKKLIAVLLVIAIVLVSICIAVFIIKSNDSQKTDTDYDTEESDSAKDKKRSEKEDAFNGSVLVLKPDIDDISAIKEEDMDAAASVIRSRLDKLGYAEAKISREDDMSFRIEIPNCDDPMTVADSLIAAAKLEFLDADNNVIMGGSKENIKNTKALYGPVSEDGENIHYIQLTFTKKGQEAFAKATEAAVNADYGKNYISIALDGVVQTAPTVNEVINADTCIITGDYTGEEAEKIVALINSGQLPFAFKVVEFHTVES